MTFKTLLAFQITLVYPGDPFWYYSKCILSTYILFTDSKSLCVTLSMKYVHCCFLISHFLLQEPICHVTQPIERNIQTIFSLIGCLLHRVLPLDASNAEGPN